MSPSVSPSRGDKPAAALVNNGLDSITNSRVIPGKEACHSVCLAYSNAVVDSLVALPGQTVVRGDVVMRLRRTVPDTFDDRRFYLHAEVVSPGLLCVRDPVRSPFEGVVSCELAPNTPLVKDDVLFTITEKCGHAVQFGKLCALCGKSLGDNTEGNDDSLRAQISMVHDSMGVTVSEAVARNMDLETTERLRREHKLSLILDLDQTLVHASADPSVGIWMDSIVNERGSNCSLLSDLYRFTLGPRNIEYYLRLRPGLREFLRSAQELYELHIYTMGSRPYANKVAAIIDQDGSIFKERVLSRDESGSHHRKSLQRLFPCDQSMVVVVDDRGDMWDWNDNLIRVYPYAYFIKTGDINTPCSDSLIPSSALADALQKIDIEESAQQCNKLPIKSPDNDKELRILLTKLAELHGFFHLPASLGDVRKILPEMKAKVLRGCEILFTGPHDRMKADAIQLASSFGAQCVHELTVNTTHVVSRKAASNHSSKAHQRGVPIVSYSWLFTSISYWSKQPEKRFLLPKNITADSMATDGSSNDEKHDGFNDGDMDDADKDENRNLPLSTCPGLGAVVPDLDELDEELAELEKHASDFGGAQDSHVLFELDAELREWMGDSYDDFAAGRNQDELRYEDKNDGDDREYVDGDGDGDDDDSDDEDKDADFDWGEDDVESHGAEFEERCGATSLLEQTKRKRDSQGAEESNLKRQRNQHLKSDGFTDNARVVGKDMEMEENEDDEIFFDFREVLGSDSDCTDDLDQDEEAVK